MPSLALKPLRPFSDHTDSTAAVAVAGSQPQRASSPVAPAFSPITPKLQPNLPVKPQAPFVPPEHGADFTFSAGSMPTTNTEKPPVPAMSDPPQYLPQPPNLPFSGEDATDAIALRAAISTLQFQKKKAQDDLRKLESIKKLALNAPDQFKTQLAAGKVTENRPTLGNLQAILDEAESSDDDDDDDDEDSVALGAQEQEERRSQSKLQDSPLEIPDSQESRPVSRSAGDASFRQSKPDKPLEFPRIPGPQAVVRMPPVNWDKYGIVGEGLDSLHEQQRRWPGSAPFVQGGGSRGRDHTIAAPYSPFLDTLDTRHRLGDANEMRKDSAVTPMSAMTGASEHPMITRNRA